MNAYAWNIGSKVSFFSLLFFLILFVKQTMESTGVGFWYASFGVGCFLLEYSHVRHLRYGDICCFNLASSVPMKYGTFKNSMVQVEGGIKAGIVDCKVSSVSSVNLIKGSRVSETTTPDLIDHLLCVGLVPAGRSCPHGKNRSSPNALLVLLSEFPLASSEELSRPSAFTAQRTCSNLADR